MRLEREHAPLAKKAKIRLADLEKNKASLHWAAGPRTDLLKKTAFTPLVPTPFFA